MPTTDGTDEIDAWIMRPAGFEPRRKYPVLLNVHGGPFTQYGETFFDEAQMQAAAGFVVVMSQPARQQRPRTRRGGRRSSGRKHQAVKGGTGWGSVDVDDVLAVIDAALDRYPFCDRDRVGMLGGSYGGYMATMLAARHGERFRAICSRAGGQQHAHRGVGQRHRHRVQGRRTASRTSTTPTSTCGCHRSSTSATSTCRC